MGEIERLESLRETPYGAVRDAGFFRDPITAHGITDALRESEFLARAILEGDDAALVAYRALFLSAAAVALFSLVPLRRLER